MALLSQTQLGQFQDKYDLDHKISSCIMSALAMWCHVPSLASNKFDLANWRGSQVLMKTAVEGPNLA